MPLVLAGATSGSATVQATDAATVTLTLPATSGTLSVSGGSNVAGGSTTQVQYNSSGALAGSSNFVFDGTNVGIGTSSPVTKLNVVQSSAADAIIRLNNTNGGVYASNLNIDSSNQTGSRYSSLYSSYSGTYQWSISGGGSDATIAFGTGSSNTERMRIDSSGNVGIGVSPSYKFQVQGASSTDLLYVGTAGGNYMKFGGMGSGTAYCYGFEGTVAFGNAYSGGSVQLWAGNATKYAIDSGGNVSSVIPSGSTLYPEFKCRAWVSFNSDGSIRGSGNVSSVSVVNSSNYNVNLTTAMPDTNYGVQWTVNVETNHFAIINSTSQINCRSGGSFSIGYMAIFR
jgi:hypothetical protein